MEQGNKNPFFAECLAKSWKHKKCTEEFNDEGNLEYETCHLDDSAYLMGGEAVLKDAPFKKSDLLSGDRSYDGGYRYDAKAPDLYEYQDHSLPEP